MWWTVHMHLFQIFSVTFLRKIMQNRMIFDKDITEIKSWRLLSWSAAYRYIVVCGCVLACACVIIVGLCYLVSQQLSHYYIQTQLSHDKVLVQFSVGFYIITSAGAVSIAGVACTLLRRVRSSSSRISNSSSGGNGGGRSAGIGRRGWLSTGRRPLEPDLERLADAASPSTDRTPPPYRR